MWGDPHYNNFDNVRSKYNKLNFFGQCTYTLVRDGCAESQPVTRPRFELVAKLSSSDEAIGPSVTDTTIVKINDGRNLVRG